MKGLASIVLLCSAVVYAQSKADIVNAKNDSINLLNDQHITAAIQKSTLDSTILDMQIKLADLISTKDSVEKVITEPFQPLVDKMKANYGIDITPILFDPRFEIYTSTAKYVVLDEEKKPAKYEVYKKRHSFDKRVEAMPEYIAENDSVLREINRDYTNVPTQLIPSLSAFETVFGTVTGDKLAINALLTLYILNHRVDELVYPQIPALFKIAEKSNMDIFQIASNDFGAMGEFQFLASTWQKYGVGDFNNSDDWKRSGANYLSHLIAHHGNFEDALYNWNRQFRFVKMILEGGEESRILMENRNYDLFKVKVSNKLTRRIIAGTT
ncbi:MAG: lytic murein transglycosylase [archaeon]